MSAAGDKRRLRWWRDLPALPGPRPDTGARLNDRHRLLICLASLLVVIAAALPTPGLTITTPVRVLALQFAPGVAVVLWAGVRSAHRFVLYALTIGSGLLILTSTAMAWSAWWHVETVAACWLAATAAMLGARAVRFWLGRDAGGDWPPAPVRGGRRPGRAATLTTITIIAGWLLAVSVAWLRRDAPQPAGMALTAGGWWFAGLALVVAGSLLSLRRLPQLRPLSVTALASVTTVSQAAMYAMPTVIVAGRHVGVGEFVRRNGFLLPDLDIYQAWVGLFTSTAFIVQSAGIAEPLTYANWWGALSAPVMALAVRTAAGRFVGADRAWLAGLVFALGSSLNTAFYAPQVYGFIASFTVVAMLLGIRGERSRSLTMLRCGGALVISSASAITHQLSPYMITVALAMLLLTRILRPWWLVLIPSAPALFWLWVNHSVVTRYISPGAFGRLFANLAPPTHPPPPLGIPLANRLTFGLPALLLVTIGLVAVWQLVRHRDRLALALMLSAGSPALLMVMTDYGAEGIFRVALFALPWLAVLASRERPAPRAVPAVARLGPARRSALRALATTVALVALVGINLTGLTGMDWARVMRADDVAVIRHFERTAPFAAVLMHPGSQLATPVAVTENYLTKGYFSRESLIEYYRPGQHQVYPRSTGADYDAAADLAELTRTFMQAEAPAHYLLVSDSSQAYNYRYGLQRPADYDKMRRAVADSGYWILDRAVGNTRLYRLAAPPGEPDRLRPR